MVKKDSILNNEHIKQMRPRKNSKYHQGYVPESLCSKLYNSVRDEPIIYRSGLELQFIQFCENNPKILHWASEPIKIPYFNRIRNKTQNYYPDYVIENDKHERIIVEVKPFNQTVKPDIVDSRWSKETWITNIDKWTAARAFADEHNMKFIIVTEKFFE